MRATWSQFLRRSEFAGNPPFEAVLESGHGVAKPVSGGDGIEIRWRLRVLLAGIRRLEIRSTVYETMDSGPYQLRG